MSVKSPLITYCCGAVADMTSWTLRCNDCHKVMENSKFEFRAVITKVA